MCAQIAGIQDFRGEGVPGDIGVFQATASILIFQFAFSGVTYSMAIRAGQRGWVPISVQSVNATTVFQDAFNALPASGGEIFVEKGLTDYLFYQGATANRCVVPPNGNFKLRSDGATIKMADNQNSDLFFISAKSDWLIEGLGLDGNKANNAVIGPGVDYPNGIHPKSSPSYNNKIIGCHFKNFNAHATKPQNCLGLIVENCFFEDCNWYEIAFDSTSSACIAQKNIILRGYGVETFTSSNDCEFLNNIIMDTVSDNAAMILPNRCVCIGNILINIHGEAISMSGTDPTLIEGNILITTLTGGTTFVAINISQGTENKIIKNNILINPAVGNNGINIRGHNCIVEGNYIKGFVVGVNLSENEAHRNNSVTCNIIYNNSYRDITIGSLSENTIVDGNIIRNSTSTVAILDLGNNTLITENIIMDRSGIAISLAGTNKSTVESNILLRVATGVAFPNAAIFIEVAAGFKTIRDNTLINAALGPAGIVVRGDDCIIDRNYVTGFTAYGIIDYSRSRNKTVRNRVFSNGVYDIRLLTTTDAICTDNDFRGSTSTNKFSDEGTGTILATVRACFIKELGTAAWIVTAASVMGIDIDAADEGALAKIKLPLDLQKVVRIVVWGTAQVAEADHMLLTIAAGAGGDNEAWNAEAIAKADKPSASVNFANLDNIYWVFTSADDSDIGDLAAGDSLQWCCYYNAVVGVDCATDLLLAGEELEIQYV